MLRVFSWFGRQRAQVSARTLPIILQGLIHLAVVYYVARSTVEWVLYFVHDDLLIWLHHPSTAGTIQYYAAHEFAASIPVGLIVGLISARFLRSRVSRYVWIVPVLILALAIVFAGPGVYPTMPFRSDWSEAFRYYFSGGFSLPARLTWQDLASLTVGPQFVRFGAQFRVVVPAIVGISYAFGAIIATYVRLPLPELCFRREETPATSASAVPAADEHRIAP